MSGAGRSPVGVEMLDVWKWQNPSFPRGCRKSFPGHLMEMQEPQETGHYQTSRTIFVKMSAVNIPNGLEMGQS
jgi:hypothetical protein